MAHTLEEFAATCHRILSQNPGPEGRKQVVAAEDLPRVLPLRDGVALKLRFRHALGLD